MNKVIQGDCLEVLRTLPDNSVDSIVTDPPAGIEFMGKEWDSSKGGRDYWVAWLTEIMREALRVLKPGGHALVWSIPRTSHWTGLALEDAGFEIRDSISHIYGEGMPKSHNIGKAIDKMAGAERKVVGEYDSRGKYEPKKAGRKSGTSSSTFTGKKFGKVPVTAPATEDAQTWEGWGTGLKPAVETWWLVRKPLAEDTIAANVLEYGTGALNIDASRVATDDQDYYKTNSAPSTSLNSIYNIKKQIKRGGGAQGGRWPANLLLSHSLYCQPDMCTDDCPVRLLDEQSGNSRSQKAGFHGRKEGIHVYNGQKYHKSATMLQGGMEYGDQGGASRYFQRFYYASKPGRKERNAGCEGLPAANNHPTVKSINLMRYLTRLITPLGGTVLDTFGGSGTTALACIAEGFNYILIEREPEYIAIIEARIAHAEKEAA